MYTTDEIIAATDEFGIPENMRYDACILAGIPEDCASFICEWYPEIADCYAIGNLENWGYYNSMTFAVMTEEELTEFLDGMTEEEYEYKFGIIIRDDAFEDVLVCGE